MAKSKKYTCRIVQDNDAWTAEVVRRVTAKKSVVTKSQAGFATDDEAEAWGLNEVKTLVKTANLNERNKRRAKKERE
ncbi:MAG: DUF3622 domain-containing protein [Gammaproteobacteria bacterium]|nr:DUF3622 domain-containing protein [Gammaproteobacteria bacterium]MCW8910354.1 DUF3622 domain-containing protein [Gammaproteobacteria bacterium]MCW9005320.1 DUF3622 domain-containing protein [Gammaproteobacteria bacterium]MCW9057005.1 DUF3622 domain-containing protein [Gammaproteobacteria bacterium]